MLFALDLLRLDFVRVYFCMNSPKFFCPYCDDTLLSLLTSASLDKSISRSAFLLKEKLRESLTKVYFGLLMVEMVIIFSTKILFWFSISDCLSD